MTSMANMKPERRNAGRKVAIMATWVARSWERARAEMNIPSPREPSRKKNDITISSVALPRNGTSNSSTPSTDVVATSIMPMAR